jgi:capsular polysaccharide export protein
MNAEPASIAAAVAAQGLAPGVGPGVAPPWRTVAVFSPGLARIPRLDALLGAERVVVRPGAAQAVRIDAVVGWGNKRTAEPAMDYARQHALPYWRAEDGFLRSIGLGRGGAAPLSLVLDDRGIYYDARTPSRLEALLAGDAGPLDDAALLARARRAMQRILEAGLSKYNDTPPGPARIRARESGASRTRVLVVDQTSGDLSIEHGLAGPDSFARMIEAALCEHPGAEILVKTHPDVLAGHRRGCIPSVARTERVRLIADPVNPLALLGDVDHVYAVTSQLGFEALLAGKPVTVFGAPFYAGWGLTDDRQAIPRRQRRRTLEQLFAAAYILYPRYLDPESGGPGQIEDVIEHLARQRQTFASNQGTIFCLGFRPWKQGYVRAYLRCPGNRVVFARNAAHAERLGCSAGAKLLVWGQRAAADVETLSKRHAASIWRMEDGFLRSVGLGSDFVTPASLVVDRQGIYYDPRTPSDLESILQTAVFSPDELVRARALRETMVRDGLSKYNIGERRRLDVPVGKRIILVPGQVEDDASIQLGCPGDDEAGRGAVRTNEALLRAVRASAPGVYVIYKPHPDVVAGNRRGHVAEPVQRGLCDRVEMEAAIADCLATAHEVHTMTSLVGFEALLRGLRVVVYGQPFYASWGLTDDRAPVARRTRALTLDALVAGTLIRYPRYLHPETGAFTTPETILVRLRAARDRAERGRGGGATRLRVSWMRRQVRKLVHIARGMLDAA